MASVSGPGDLNAEYVYGLERVSQERGGVRSYFPADGHGLVRQLTDSVGNVTDTYDYTAFGEALASTGTTVNEFRYVGEQADPNSGFYYLRARWMDPSVGRFTAKDPFDGDPQAPIGLHRYQYGNQSPINWSDPSGNVSIMDISIAFVLIGTLYNLAHQEYLITSHYVSERNGYAPILWEGDFYSGSAGPAPIGPEAGLIIAHLESKKRDGAKIKVDCLIFLLGMTISLPPGSVLRGDLEVTTPVLFGYSAWALAGPVSFFSGTVALGPGRTGGVLHIGSGIGEFSIASEVKGYEVGLDLMGGVSTAVEAK